MNTDLTTASAVHPWSKNTYTSSLIHTDSDSSAWTLPSLLRAPNSARLSCERMYSAEADPSSDPQHLDPQLDFFHKLGYSTTQVQAIQQKFGPSVDTDKVLGELVRIGARREAKKGPVTTMSVLVPKGETHAGGPMMLLPLTVSSPQKEESGEDEDALRPIVIDGSNVAMSHGNKEVFSCLGIQLAVNFFLEKGHSEITVFVPSWRKEQPRPDVPITDQHILRDLEKKKILVFTPSRRVAGKRVVCNDDCFIVKEAFESDGIIVSNDMYRDLQVEKPNWKRFIEERLLMYSFVNNKFMPPDDPLGRHGPTLENFLRRFPKNQKRKPCPYGKKCTYGIKCKFHHPERANQSNRSVADELRDSAKQPSSSQKQSSPRVSPVPGQSLSLVEDMAKKLTLGHESNPSKKDHKHEHVAHSKGSHHRSGKRSTSRRDKNSHKSSSDQGSLRQSGSHEQLDSGLGSIDSQPMEAPWSMCDKYGSPHHPLGVRQQYCAPCSCCSHGPASQGTTQAFQHHNQRCASDLTPYGQPLYASYKTYPVSMPTYNKPVEYQQCRVRGRQQQFWSDPFGAHPAAGCNPPREHSHWERTQPSPDDADDAREVVRKKLLAIFSAHLVDTAMSMFPQQLDPQKLVAEILVLQSQDSGCSAKMWQSVGLTLLVIVATLVCALLFMLFGWYVVWQLFLSKFKFLRELVGDASTPQAESQPSETKSERTANPPTRNRPRTARQRATAAEGT
ncbi:endoribonuclease ZC3H12A [Xyrichtys novacula]|uniref:Endoribonuclease ZC3H12A n=1 Tax=Xyrichtys novacula TaxID=13765 RepID=A0AAV1HEL9_XYRNO|nr:endoribonuclease ZC3H12A [Xyrichtys novacula]